MVDGVRERERACHEMGTDVRSGSGTGTGSGISTEPGGPRASYGQGEGDEIDETCEGVSASRLGEQADADVSQPTRPACLH